MNPAERNKEPILAILKKILPTESKKLLEIGCGNAIHASCFAPQFKNISWYTSDVAQNHSQIKTQLKNNPVANLLGPLEFEVGKTPFPKEHFDIVYAANILHIMTWKENKTLFRHLGHRLREGREVIFYGPFNYNGTFTTPSNQEFDQWLKEKNPLSGIRSFEKICELMKKNGFHLTQDYEMPANNRLLHFTKIETIL